MELITVELRPRLQSCNVFIAVKKNITLRNVRVELSENNIALVLKDCKYCTINFSLPFVKVIPTSLSMLSIKNNWICFRLQTAPSESVFGSFSTEVVTDLNKSVKQTTCSQPILEDIELLFKASECSILCACCKNVISEPVTFKRVLPFPDAEYDLDEWFCCKHSSNTIANNLEPNISDYLYGSYFSMLHKNIFRNNLHINNKTLSCNKCLLHIGTLCTYNLYKIWNCCVDYKPQNNTLNVVSATNPLNDFLILVKNSLSEILGEEIILQTSVGKHTHYLLIRPMDCKLNLFTESNHSVISDTISLQQKCVAKVLYKYDTNEVTTTTNYSNVKYHEVGLPIMEAGLKHLLSSTKRLPHVYRTVTSYLLGYILLQEVIN